MIRLRQWSALILTVLLTPSLRAQDKPTSPWAIDRTLHVSPQSAPVPALKYRLLPLSSELKEGNAVPIYLRLVHEQNDAAQKYWREAPVPWNAMPVDKIPLDEARKFFQRMGPALRQLELGARRRTAEWNYTLDQGDILGVLLPDAQNMRGYVPMLVLQVRVALAERDFTKAAHHLETNFAISRHVSEGPFLVNGLVAVALASQFAGTVADFVEHPDAPNLYWALADLPHPLIDLRRELDIEYRMLEKIFPELDDLDRERTAEQWEGVWQRVWIAPLRNLAMEGKPPKLPDYFRTIYKDRSPEDPPAKSPSLPAARKFVARTRGLSAEQVEAMPPAQALLLYIVGKYHEERDDLFRAISLPYPQAHPLVDAVAKRQRATPTSEVQLFPHLLLPAVGRVLALQTRLERNVAALRVIEALRIYAAAHDGKLPDRLDDVTDVPVPDDPGTGRPFEYRREGDTATLISQVPDDPLPNNGLRYHVTTRKK